VTHRGFRDSRCGRSARIRGARRGRRPRQPPSGLSRRHRCLRAAPPASSFSGSSAIMHSVVNSIPETEAAFCRAVRVTLVGSITPAAIRSPYSSMEALKPKAPSRSLTFSTITEPSRPQLEAIWRTGSSIARIMIWRPRSCSPSSLSSATALMQRIKATPPPGTTFSSTAARVALSASSTRAFFSFISISVAAPTLMTATPPISLARRSWSFSRS